MKKRIVIIFVLCFIGYTGFRFWVSFNKRFKEVGILKSRISYALRDNALNDLEKVSVFENKNRVRIFDFKIKDSCRLYVIDFPTPNTNFMRPKIREAKIDQVQLKYYSSLETGTYDFLCSVNTDLLETSIINIQNGVIDQLIEQTNSISFSASFDKLSFGNNNLSHDLIIDSWYPSSKCNIFFGGFEEQSVVALLFLKSGNPLSSELFTSIFR